LRICIFDNASGISGDMTLAALLDCGLTLPGLRRRLEGLRLPGWTIRRRRVVRNGIRATRVDVGVPGRERPRGLGAILEILERSEIPVAVRERAAAIFRRLARAEAKVHGERLRDVHFHEVGATDAIVDVVGVVTALDMLGVEAVYAGPVPLGTGFVETAHGRMPLPAPATLELLRGYPVVRTDRREELTTPTGAALVAGLSKGTDPPAPVVLERVGYGAGRRESPDHPNLLRALLCETDAGTVSDRVLLVETNIDDMDPQLFPHLQEKITAAGALDVFRVPVQMKKDRPGVLLRALVDADAFERVTEAIFRESTTIGLRYWPVGRIKLRRRTERVRTELGTVRVKTVVLPTGERRRKPEHDDCVRIARERGLPLPDVVDRIERELGR
jgi:hypothetical protein